MNSTIATPRQREDRHALQLQPDRDTDDRCTRLAAVFRSNRVPGTTETQQPFADYREAVARVLLDPETGSAPSRARTASLASLRLLHPPSGLRTVQMLLKHSCFPHPVVPVGRARSRLHQRSRRRWSRQGLDSFRSGSLRREMTCLRARSGSSGTPWSVLDDPNRTKPK